MGLLSWVPILKPVIGWIGRRIEQREELVAAKHDAKVAEAKAQADIAAYKVKADVEWDLKWADQASTSWKDEFIMVLWTVPMLGLIVSMFIPPMRPAVHETLSYLEQLHPDFAVWYMGGWAVIFSAAFGMKAALNIMAPGRAATVFNAVKGVDDDIPDEFIKRISGGLSRK